MYELSLERYYPAAFADFKAGTKILNVDCVVKYNTYYVYFRNILTINLENP